MKKLSLVVAALLAGSPAYAQDRTAKIDTIFNFATAETPGCAVGVSQNGRVVVNRAYGLADVEKRTALSESSRFDIGSTQKQFTAASMLLLAEEGRLSLSDDIRKYLPELPDYGHTITIDNLLTHTAGIRDWTGILPMAPEGSNVLQLILRQRGLNFVPGQQWSYSNSGYELAKEIVARVSGMSFAEFTRRRLFEPLGMTATAYVPDILHAGANAALGYQKDGSIWKPYMRLGNNRAGGAIASTVRDMVVWQDALASGKLGRFVTEKIHERARLPNGRTLTYARGLMVDSTPGGLVISHSGGAAGYSTWMGRIPEHNLSVAVSCNFDPVSATNLAGRVIDDVFLPPLTDEQRALARAATRTGVPGVDVTSRAGLFFDERTGEPMRLGVNNGRLMVANGPPLVPVSATSFRPPRANLFFRSQDDFELSFLDSDHIEIRSMEGQVTRYRRAQPWTPSPADLRAVDGRYESPEIGSSFEIVSGSNTIAMRLENAPEQSLELTPVARETYMVRMVMMRFRRDDSGKVVGFEYSNPVAAGLRFTRLGARTTAGDAAAAPVAATSAPAAAPSASTSSAVRLERLTGEYELAGGRTLAILLEGGRLHGQPTGQEKLPLTYVSGTTFSAAAGRTLTFTLGADGRATAVVMSQNGNERTLPRVR